MPQSASLIFPQSKEQIDNRDKRGRGTQRLSRSAIPLRSTGLATPEDLEDSRHFGERSRPPAVEYQAVRELAITSFSGRQPMRERKMAEAHKSRKIPDKSRKIAEAYKSWRQTPENMRAALAMIPLVTEPFRTSPQAFDSAGRVLLG